MEKQVSVCVEIPSVSVDEEKGPRSSSGKKPPRPQRGGICNLEVEQQKKKKLQLIAELSMMKKARIERMKALLMQKKLTSSSSSSSSSSNTTTTLFAMIFTIIVFLLILFQGMSCQISCGTLEAGAPPPPPPSHETNESGLIFIHHQIPAAAHDSV